MIWFNQPRRWKRCSGLADVLDLSAHGEWQGGSGVGSEEAAAERAVAVCRWGEHRGWCTWGALQSASGDQRKLAVQSTIIS